MGIIYLDLPAHKAGMSSHFFVNLTDEHIQGRDTTLNETDVPNLSITMRSRPVYAKFDAI